MLIEALIAVAIVGAAAVGLAVMLSKGQAFISGNGDDRVAVYLAQHGIEQARARAFGSLTMGTTTEYFDKQMVKLASATSPGRFYTRTTVIDCVNPTDYTSGGFDCTVSPTPPKQVTITVLSAPPAQAVDPALGVTLRAVLHNPDA